MKFSVIALSAAVSAAASSVMAVPQNSYGQSPTQQQQYQAPPQQYQKPTYQAPPPTNYYQQNQPSYNSYNKQQSIVVQSGDTCTSILTKTGYPIRLAQLLQYNPEINPQCTNLCPGNTLWFVSGHESAYKPSCQAESYGGSYGGSYSGPQQQTYGGYNKPSPQQQQQQSWGPSYGPGGKW